MLHNVLLIGGAAIALAGLIGMVLAFRRKRTFAVLANAEIVDVHEDVDMNDSGKKVTNYVPVVSFMANEEEIRDMLNIRSGRKKKFKVGNKIDIYYNPKNPKRYIAAKTRNAIAIPVCLMVVGIAGVIASFFQ
ncbi:MAG: DUF3592 domain-containing protein [Lachnospiraceae bacterium]|nr:DUF3592 domain-containing protein [Lachnospiraceae bacterium]